MLDRRGLRFALEVVYLGALAAALAFTTLGPALIVAVMLCGWLLLAASERAAVGSRPHFAAGLPPRWHVPAVALPPAQPLEQVAPAYPELERDDAPTWIASAALREELLGEWPILIEPEDTQEAPPDDWIVPLPLPEPEPEPEVAAGPEIAAAPEVVPEPVLQVAAAPEPEPELRAAVVRTARYHVDPFAEPERGRFGRRREAPSIEVPAKPTGPPPLPSTYREAE